MTVENAPLISAEAEGPPDTGSREPVVARYVRDQLIGVLGLDGCWFEYGLLLGHPPRLEPDGTVMASHIRWECGAVRPARRGGRVPSHAGPPGRGHAGGPRRAGAVRRLDRRVQAGTEPGWRLTMTRAVRSLPDHANGAVAPPGAKGRAGRRW